jgi:cytochrome P450
MSTAPRIAPATQPYPPGPSFLSRLLSGRAFRSNSAQYMLECAQTYGDLVHFKAFNRHIYQLNHPALIEDFFLKDAARHHRGIVMQRARFVLGNGLLTSEEPLHMRQRRLAQPAFHRRRIAVYADTIGHQAVAMSRRWAGRPAFRAGAATPLDLHEEMLAIALRIVGTCLFDLDVESAADVRTISLAVDAFMGFLPLAILPFSSQIQRLPLPAMRRIRKGSAQLDDLIYTMIRNRRAEQSEFSGASDPPLRSDLLSMLMEATDPEAAPGESASMSDRQLRDECLTILLAGHETTANGLSFALALLARHPEIQAAVSAEARAVLGDRTPTAADYPRLPYTTQVFAESLRLYPPVWVTARTVTPSPALSQPYQIAGFTIPPGAILIASQFVVHHDPRFYPDPLRFDPSRFTDANKATRPRYAYFPFAGGSRQCIGEGLAWMEGVFVLAVIARDWRLTLPPGASPEIDSIPSITLRPKQAVLLNLEPLS